MTRFSFYKISVFLAVLSFCLLPFGLNGQTQQQQLITGVVYDESGLTMTGVGVYDPANLEKGTVTDESGRFSISIAASCKALTFSFIGYNTKQVPVKATMSVTLEPNKEFLDAVVVTGIFTRKAESFTGAVQSITADELKRVGNKNIIQSLKNIDPSLLITENLEMGSDPNTMAQMQLRGASSFVESGTTSLKSNFTSNVNQPLFILDGFETSLEKIQDMDMNRVESITILKDASAKAIYGSKAGNGVIVVETKSLKSNQTQVSYIGSAEIEMPDLTSYNLCNALEKLEIERREGFYDLSTINPVALQNREDLFTSRYKKALEGESTYWLSKPLRVGVGQKHSLSVELGTKDLRSITDISYNRTEGTMKGSFREVISGDMNLSYRKGAWTFRNIMSVYQMNSSDSPYGDFYQYAQLNPYYNPYDENGNLVRLFNTDSAPGGDKSLQGTIGNPLYDATLNLKLTSEYFDFTDNLYCEFQPIKALKIVGRFGIETKRTSSEEFYPAAHSKFSLFEYSTKQGTYDQSNGRYNSYSADISAQFNHSINEIHDIFATAQYSVSQTDYGEIVHYAEGFPNSHMNSITFARQYAQDKTPTGAYGLNRNIGALLTAGYTYKGKYMVDATAKASASSVFGTNNRWGLFWSTGLAWNLHNEDFLKDIKEIEMFKLRCSVGSSGNQNYSTNNSLAVYNYENYWYNGFTAASLSNMENPLLGWEQKMDYNVGLDIRSKWGTLTADAYIADTDNLVFNRSILSTTGFTTVNSNLGKVRNKGVEVGGNVKVYQKGNSFVSIFAKIALNDNKILKLSDALRNYNLSQQTNAQNNNLTTPVVQYFDGAPMNAIWAVKSLGIDPKTGKEIFLDRDGNMTNTWKATDLVLCGSSDPLYNGNFGFNGEIKGFGLSAVMTFYGGGYRYNSTLVNMVENVSIATNVDKRIYSGRWFEEGQVAQYRNGYTSPTQATTRFVQRNNVLNLSSVNFYYEFPYKSISKLKLSRLRLSAYMNDICTLSSIQIERGTSYPYARTVSFGVTATF